MTALPFAIAHVGTPPIKCQGIKTKLVPFIFSCVRWNSEVEGRWIEPFLGSGVVALNLAPPRTLVRYEQAHYRLLSSHSARRHEPGKRP